MESPSFCCPSCGGRTWTLSGGLWTCDHTERSDELTELHAWADYQFRTFSEIAGLLEQFRKRKDQKAADDLPALFETTEIIRLSKAIETQEKVCMLAQLLELLSEDVEAATVQLIVPKLRFRWDDRTNGS